MLTAIRFVLLAGAGGVLAACRDTTVAGDVPGDLTVAVATAGGDPPLAPYLIRETGSTTSHQVTVFRDGSASFDDLDPGPHRIELLEVPPNCSAQPGLTQDIVVGGPDTSRVAFLVTCQATGIEVVVATTGLDPDAGYVVTVNGTADAIVTTNDTASIGRMVPGRYSVELKDIAGNCTRTGAQIGPVPVDVVANRLSRIDLTVGCVAATGVLRVTVRTTGDDRDINGFAVFLGPVLRGVVGVEGSTDYDGVVVGPRSIRLDGVAGNCAVAGPNPQAAVLTGGTLRRDTATVAFEVRCERAWTFAFERDNWIRLASADGAIVDSVRSGRFAAWAVDGNRLGYICGGICLSSLDRGVTSQFLTGTAIDDASLRGDGLAIAFTRGVCDFYYCYFEGLYTVGLDGGGLRKVELPAMDLAASPAWSPDGGRLAFECTFGNSQDLCVVNVDGSGFRRLTTSVAVDAHPRWRPDGGKLVFSTSSPRARAAELATINPDGTGFATVGPLALGYFPDWSPDGSRLVFNASECVPGGCRTGTGLATVRLDGTGFTRVTTGNDIRPRWRP